MREIINNKKGGCISQLSVAMTQYLGTTSLKGRKTSFGSGFRGVHLWSFVSGAFRCVVRS